MRILVVVLCFLMVSCGIFFDDLSQAQKYVSQENYEEAIKLLDSYHAANSKKYNAEVHLIYADKVLQNFAESRFHRYHHAKELIERSLQLDPKNTKAKAFYLMISKLIKQDLPENIIEEAKNND
ncbi:MAG: hypothetical protein LW817_08305 [Candidatus Caenarcaniphilales bacterium]|jgi:tetratricopeptide (TPR) repeat protein|nr:hypothetical protein [Candidatus Caenarcaniphilales bacterium]